MNEIPVYEAKTRLSELLVEIEHGAQFTITRRGQPVARLVGMSSVEARVEDGQTQIATTIADLRAQRQGVSLEGDLRQLIADGRD